MLLDQYFTPEHVADTLVSGAGSTPPNVCVDASCGAGSLLRAVERRFPRARCVGMDVDASAIRKIRKHHPEWVLSVGDIFAEQVTAALRAGRACDFVLANPPFSMRKEKGRRVEYGGTDFRCSVAMAHILRAVELFAPARGLLALVPESLMFSDLDAPARERLGEEFRLQVIEQMNNTTFSGASVNSLILEVKRGAAPNVHRTSRKVVLHDCELIRGGLPMHEAVHRRSGSLFIHSTAISLVAEHSEHLSRLPSVTPISRGRVAGNVILLPRVGLPLRTSIRRIWLRETAQLSDCVIALRFPNAAIADTAAMVLQRNHARIVDAYHGTGARYTTVRHLSQTLGPLSSQWAARG